MRRWLLACVAMAMLAGCHVAERSEVVPAAEYHAAIEQHFLFPENRTHWVIKISGEAGTRVTDETVMSPKQGGFSFQLFRSLGAAGKLEPGRSDVFLIHITAAKNGSANESKELYFTIPARLTQAHRAHEIKLIIEESGATLKIGTVKLQQPWINFIP